MLVPAVTKQGRGATQWTNLRTAQIGEKDLKSLCNLSRWSQMNFGFWFVEICYLIMEYFFFETGSRHIAMVGLELAM